MTLVRWRPAQELFRLHDDLDRMCDSFIGKLPRFWSEDYREGRWTPRVDISESKDDIIVKAEIPGMTKDQIKVSLQDNILTIRGEKKQEQEEKEASFHRVERSYGAFVRSFSLPTLVRSDQIKASYKDGILKITLPKVEEVKPKEIPVQIS